MLRSLEDLRAQGQVARLVLAAKDWVKEASSGIGELASHLGGGGREVARAGTGRSQKSEADRNLLALFEDIWSKCWGCRYVEDRGLILGAGRLYETRYKASVSGITNGYTKSLET